MNYPVVIHKDKTSDYGVTVPDLPGCFSAGATLDEALALAKEAIEIHLEGMIEMGRPIPKPASFEKHKSNRDFAGGTWAVVAVDESTLRLRAQRINITMPQRVLDAVDRFAEQRGETRSGVLVQAVTEYIGRSAAGKPKTARRPRRGPFKIARTQAQRPRTTKKRSPARR